MTASRGAIALLAGLAVTPAAAQEIDVDKLATGCTGCHRIDGKTFAGVPDIVGMEAAAIEAALKEFKAGERTGEVMNQVVARFGDAEFAALAAYFAAK